MWFKFKKFQNVYMKSSHTFAPKLFGFIIRKKWIYHVIFKWCVSSVLTLRTAVSSLTSGSLVFFYGWVSVLTGLGCHKRWFQAQGLQCPIHHRALVLAQKLRWLVFVWKVVSSNPLQWSFFPSFRQTFKEGYLKLSALGSKSLSSFLEDYWKVIEMDIWDCVRLTDL